MAFRLDYDQTNKLLLMSFAGPLTDEAMLAGYAALRTAKERCGPCRCIIDTTGVTTAAELTNETIRWVVNMPPTGSPELPQIDVAPSDLIFGMARMFQILSSETRPNLHVVRTLDEAYRLLRVEAAKFVPLSAE